ncbi:MAG: glycosyltransferase [Pseudoflavonifractor sp.]|nr:glycosyltransferase [Alloprevotella sp.]MCM1117260.1 glycosyltransferase [Pseudoflavonifractor sp.]
MEASPLFTIITVTYNAESTLPATLKSIASQDYAGEIEQIIIDGSSKDSTVEIARELALPGSVIVSEPDRGLYDAMNKGLERAHGLYLIFLNAGDAFHGPDVLSRYAEAIRREDMPGIVYGQTILVDNERRKVGERHFRAPEHLDYNSFADGMKVCHQAMAVLRSITGHYNRLYRFSADYEWTIRCLQHSRKNVYVGPEPVIDYLSEGVTTNNEYKSLRERFRIMCYYYGIKATLLRHVEIFFRGFGRKLKAHFNK